MDINSIFNQFNFEVGPGDNYRKAYFLNEGAIIMIDDINFTEVENGSKDFVKKYSSKYKIIKEIKTFNNHCHPRFWNGVMIIKKNKICL